MEVCDRIAARAANLNLVFATQPSAQPIPRVAIHGAVSFTDRTKAKVVRPTFQQQVEFPDYFLRMSPTCVASSHFADRVEQSEHSFLRGSRADVDFPCLRAMTLAQRVTQEVKRLRGHTTDPSLLLVYCQLQLLHHYLHPLSCFLGSVAAQDNEIIGVVHDVSLQLTVPALLLPA